MGRYNNTCVPSLLFFQKLVCYEVCMYSVPYVQTKYVLNLIYREFFFGRFFRHERASRAMYIYNDACRTAIYIARLVMGSSSSFKSSFSALPILNFMDRKNVLFASVSVPHVIRHPSWFHCFEISY